MRNVTSDTHQKIVDADIDSGMTVPNTDKNIGEGLRVRPDQKKPSETELTPNTDDRAAVLAPDDTFPGSGPARRDQY